MAEKLKLDLSIKDQETLESLLKKLREQNPDLEIQLESIEEDDEKSNE